MWSTPRLASSYALAAGLDIYPPIDQGNQLCWLYGPVFPLWLLPFTLIPRLAWAFASAQLFHGATLTAALVWAFRPISVDWRQAARRGALTALLLVSTTIFGGWLLRLHVDTPALVFLLVSLGCAERYRQTGRRHLLHGSALAAVVAIWSKQLAIAYPVMLSIYWLHEDKRGQVLEWLRFLLGYGILSALAFIGCFGLKNPWFYLVDIHAKLPWITLGEYFGQWGHNIGYDLLPWVAMAALPWLVTRRKGARSGPSQPARLSLLWWLGLSQLPLGLLAAMKFGGGLNSAYAAVFLAMAIVAGLEGASSTPRWRWGLAIVFCSLALANNLGQLGQLTPSSHQDDILALARRHRNQLYLPWNPLITILTDHKVYPFEYGLFARQLSGTPVSEASIRAALPANPVILYDRTACVREISRYLPEAKPVTEAMLRQQDAGRERADH